MAEPVALTALALEAAFGWPRALYRSIGHPVGTFAAIIAWCEKRWNNPSSSTALRRAAGIATVVILIVAGGGTGFVLQKLAHLLPGSWAWLATALLAVPGLAQRSLFDHVRAVAAALDSAGLDAARSAVGMIVGRDTAALDEAGVSRAAIESLSESFCDGIAAPLFWLLVLGLPGIWIYKAINTADSLIGHREPRWRAFGWAAARSDDLLNLIPARFGGAIICIAGGGGWRILRRDARKHTSPNAGWTEAAMAGVLGLRLAGPMAYDGVWYDKDWIGDGTSDATAEDVQRALGIYVRACLSLWLIAGTFAWSL